MNVTARKDISLAINAPRLEITTASPLPSGSAGLPYSQQLSASGGVPPYSWSLLSSSLPRGMAVSSSGALTGTPSNTGTFGFTLRVTDSAGTTTRKDFTLTINSTNLEITTTSTLVAATAGVAYSQALTGSGGVPPYGWSVISGTLPSGMTLSPGGALSGTSLSTGTFSFVVQITDMVPNRANKTLTITVGSAGVPQVLLTGLPAAIAPAQQVKLNLSLAQTYALPIQGVISLAFRPDATTQGDDATVQFSTGGRSVPFSIAATATDALFSVPELYLQTGTVAGTLSLSVRLQSGGADITPSPAPSQSATISRSSPRIMNVGIIPTASGFNVMITGFSTPREVTRATFQFTPSPGSDLQTSEFTLDMTTAFQRWYELPSSSQFGSQFMLNQPFTVQGSLTGLSAVSVTLVNGMGASNTATARF